MVYRSHQGDAVPASDAGPVIGILALQGRTKVQQATPPVPEQATESVKEDVRWAKTKAQEGRQ